MTHDNKSEKIDLQTTGKRKHSGLGIAAFITSITSGLLMFMLIVVAGVIEVTTSGGMDERSASAVIIGLLLFLFLFITLVALGLGISGLVQKDRKKIFAILGTIFSSMTMLGTLALLMIGLAMG